MSIFFPHHPVTAEIMIELDTIARKANIAEGKANIAEGKANIARDLTEAERYRQISLAARELTATLN